MFELPPPSYAIDTYRIHLCKQLLIASATRPLRDSSTSFHVAVASSWRRSLTPCKGRAQGSGNGGIFQPWKKKPAGFHHSLEVLGWYIIFLSFHGWWVPFPVPAVNLPGWCTTFLRCPTDVNSFQHSATPQKSLPIVFFSKGNVQKTAHWPPEPPQARQDEKTHASLPCCHEISGCQSVWKYVTKFDE